MNTIPKKIHYCWLSGEPLPKDIVRCMQTWRDKMPEYELVLWDKNKFDINSVDFVREAYNTRKYAFASDYIRAYALYTEGGIYLDSDVIIKKNFSDFLKHKFFIGVQCISNRISLQPEMMGSRANHPYLRDVLDWYKSHHFDKNNCLDAPSVYSGVAVNYNFEYKNELQILKDDMTVYPWPTFAATLNLADSKSYAVHCGSGNGWGYSLLGKSFWHKKITQIKFLRKLIGYKTIEDVLKL